MSNPNLRCDICGLNRPKQHISKHQHKDKENKNKWLVQYCNDKQECIDAKDDDDVFEHHIYRAHYKEYK